MGFLALAIGYIIISLTPIFGKWNKIFEKLDLNPTLAFVPFLNYFLVLKACKQPWYWIFFMLFPGSQMVMWASINVTLIRKFGEFGVKETVMGILFPFPVFWNIAKENSSHKIAEPTNWDVARQVDARTPSDHVALFFALPVIGHAIVYPLSLMGFSQKKQGKKSMTKEWGDAVLFALVAASVIRTYVFEPFQIPTGSMEKTQLIGDHLFVEKVTYGPRVPNTPFAYPIFHNMIPWVNIKSYSNIQTIPYTRLPGFRFVNRNDVTVFNFPAGDTSLNDPRMPHGLIAHNYHEILRDEAYLIALQEGQNLEYFEKNYNLYLDKARKSFVKKNKVQSRPDRERGKSYTAINGVLTRPVDRKENYIKRCVAIAGDLIEIKHKDLYIDGKLAHQPEKMQFNYILTGETGFNSVELAEKYDLHQDGQRMDYYEIGPNQYVFNLYKENYTKLKAVYGESLQPLEKEKGYYRAALKNKTSMSYYPVYPNDSQYDWTEDNFGPLRIPKKGDIVELNHKTLPLYKRIIHAYEKHDLVEKADGIYIDGKKTDTYTIEMNYYWLMGDNRNNSLDSRFWGFVPEDHVVGRAAFIWMSVGPQGYFGGVRWDRIFDKID